MLTTVVAATAAFFPQTQATEPAPGELLPVRVLYAGPKDHPRTAEWREFLAGKFRDVGTVDLPALSAATAAGWDVVVVDSPPALQPDGAFEPWPTPKLDLSFTKPTILLGAAAGSVLGPLRIKLWQL